MVIARLAPERPNPRMKCHDRVARFSHLEAELLTQEPPSRRAFVRVR